MIPKTLHHSRSVLTVFLTLIALIFLCLPERNASAIQVLPTSLVYCSANDGAVVYFTPITDTGLRLRFYIDVIGREFIEYVKGRYDYNGGGAACPSFGRMIDAETSKRKLEANARQAGKQVVETDWRYVVDPDYVLYYQQEGEDVIAVVEGMRKHTHTYCLSDSAQGTLYTTGPFETGQAVNLSYWYRGFDQLLKQKYGFKGQVFCNIGSPQEDGRLMAARIAGARAAGKKVVDTGWKYDPNVVATNNPPSPKRDDDPEPVQRPAPNPSRQASDEAMKEVPAAVAYCQKDPSMSAIFICDSFGRSVYNYRMAHLNETPEPLTAIVAKLNCGECVDTVRVSSWVEKHAPADNLSPKATNCVTQNVIVSLQTTPQANRVMEFYKKAVVACK